MDTDVRNELGGCCWLFAEQAFLMRVGLCSKERNIIPPDWCVRLRQARSCRCEMFIMYDESRTQPMWSFWWAYRKTHVGCRQALRVSLIHKDVVHALVYSIVHVLYRGNILHRNGSLFRLMHLDFCNSCLCCGCLMFGCFHELCRKPEKHPLNCSWGYADTRELSQEEIQQRRQDAATYTTTQ